MRSEAKNQGGKPRAAAPGADAASWALLLCLGLIWGASFTTTSAAVGLAEVLPHLAASLSCLAVRVPTATVSLVELVVTTREDLDDADEVVEVMREAAGGPLRGILGICDEPLVSIDFQGDTHSATVDAALVARPGPRMARVIAWYDNEYGYAQRVIDVLRLLARRG